MPRFSRNSRAQLETCHPEIIDVAETVILSFDHSIVQGHRSNEEQQRLLDEGMTTVGPGKSKHNRTPSDAVDIYPYVAEYPKHMRLITCHPKQVAQFAEYWKCSKTRAEWQLRAYFYALTARYLQVAEMKGYNFRGGHNWDGDSDLFDSKFQDLPHIERVT